MDVSFLTPTIHGVSDQESLDVATANGTNTSPVVSISSDIVPQALEELADIPVSPNSDMIAYDVSESTATSSVPFFPPLPPADEEEYVAFCLIIKDQSTDMPEFFKHHYHHHGVRRFYVIDDGSNPPLSAKPNVSSWGIPDSAINFTYLGNGSVPHRKNLQIDAYTNCTRQAMGKHKWVAWLDPDEFLEMRGKDPPTLINWLQHWERNNTVGALGVHWLTHNSNDHVTKPPGDVRKAYTMCVGNHALDPHANKKSCPLTVNMHVKTFVRPDRFKGIENIHWAKTNNGTIQVTEHGKKISTWCHGPVTHDVWALHHYVTKSWEDYVTKKGRQR